MLPEGVVEAALTYAIPHYSGLAFLGRALESIVAQSDPSWDAYVCDDGADEGVEALVRSVGRGRIRYSRNPENIGIGNNFNRCIDLAQTELVTILHNDDELKPSYGAKLRAALARHPRAVAAFCRTDAIDEHHRRIVSLTDLAKNLITPSQTNEILLAGEPGMFALLQGNFIYAPTLCFRKSVLGARRFPPEHKFVLDWDLTTALLLDGETLVGISDRCLRYRRHHEASTSKYTRTQLRFHEESEFYDRMRVRCGERGWDRCVQRCRGKRMMKLNLAYTSLKNLARLRVGDAVRGFELLRHL